MRFIRGTSASHLQLDCADLLIKTELLGGAHFKDSTKKVLRDIKNARITENRILGPEL